MTAASIALALGGGPSGGGWYRARCPVHQSTGLTLALKDKVMGGLAVVCHAGCRRVDIFTELQRLELIEDGPGIPPNPEELSRRRETEAADRVRRIASALDIWSETVPAADTLVETYLWSRLCCISAPPTIRLHCSLRHRESGERRPAMVGLVEHTDFGRVGVHATYLAVDGSCKATLDPVRKCFGPVRGGAVRLGHVSADGRLVVGEGIETTLSVMIATELPGWAALSDGGIARLILPPEARRIVIAADNDASGAGQAAATRAAARFRREGRDVTVALPPVAGCDFNDMLLCRVTGMGAHHAAR